MFKSKRKQAIDACLQKVIQERNPASWMLCPLSIHQLAGMLQRRLADEGMEVTFEEAVKRVEKASK